MLLCSQTAFACTLGGPFGERHFGSDHSIPNSLCAPTRFDFRFNGLGEFASLLGIELRLFCFRPKRLSTNFFESFGDLTVGKPCRKHGALTEEHAEKPGQ
jgi:hypothetical protein